MSSVFPRKIGPYVPLRKLGQGGMGIVYCAQDSRNGQTVALKVISKGAASNRPDAARRFLREAKILEELRHPNIVSFYEIGVHEGQNYLAMELLTGTTLSAFCGRPYGDSLSLLVQICEGMEYLVSRSIVHRDLSPDNFFVVRDEGRSLCKILDFGIAKNMASEETFHDFTKTGMLMGKPQYWSPEQIGSLKPGETLDWRSDVYALGVIFHRVLSGELPYQADTPIAYMTAHVLETPAPLVAAENCPPIPPPIVLIVEKMLRKDRTERPQSYAEIAAVLREALADEITLNTPHFFPPMGEASSGVSSRVQTASRMPTGGGRFGSAQIPSVAPTDPTWIEPVRALDFAAAETERGLPMDRTDRGQETAATKIPRRLDPQAEPSAVQRVSPRNSKAILGIASAVVIGIGLAFYVLRRPDGKSNSKSTVELGSSRDPAAVGGVGAPLSSGTLSLDAVPWAKILSVVNEGSGQKVPTTEESTPALLVLPPARYTIQLVSGTGNESRTVRVVVPPGKSVAESITFNSPEQTLSLLDEASDTSNRMKVRNE